MEFTIKTRAEGKDLENFQLGYIKNESMVKEGKLRVWPSYSLIKRLVWIEGSQVLLIKTMEESFWRHFGDLWDCHSHHRPRMTEPWRQKFQRRGPGHLWNLRACCPGPPQVSLPPYSSELLPTVGLKGINIHHWSGAKIASMQSTQVVEALLPPPRFQRPSLKASGSGQRAARDTAENLH